MARCDHRSTVRDSRRRRPARSSAALWRLPPNDHDFSTRWRLIKHGFTRRLPAALKADGRKGERAVWQRRFWEHLIRDERDFSAHLGYIHWNPVKHGYVSDMDDWPHSTWHAFKRDYGRELPQPPDGLDVGER